MAATKPVERIERMITKGEEVLLTDRPLSAHAPNFRTLDSGAFAEWKTQSISCLVSLLSEDHTHTKSFQSNVRQMGARAVNAGIGVLRAAKADLEAGHIEKPPEQVALAIIERLCNRFHTVARQLRSRHANRPTLDIQDEYDVQDLVHSLLCVNFEDIRAEEYTPSYAGKSSRLDFLLKDEATVLELKMTRAGLGVRELSSQLIEDIERYKAHPGCQTLVCFVYDPAGLIPNPRGVEADLKRDGGPFPVRVFIRP